MDFLSREEYAAFQKLCESGCGPYIRVLNLDQILIDGWVSLETLRDFVAFLEKVQASRKA